MALQIDWRRDGYQAAHLALHHSSDTSAWSMVRVPVHVLRGGDGPVTLVMGAAHGDEYEAPLAIANIARRLRGHTLHGTIILIPAINLPAAMAGTRLSPLDGRNLNREFPGDPRGSVTQRMAHAITADLIGRCDHVLDLHSGGRSLMFAPMMYVHELPDAAQTSRALRAAACFATDHVLMTREAHADVMIDDVVERQGKLMLSSELGGSGIVTPASLATAEAGLWNVLAAFGHLPGQAVRPRERPQRIVVVPGEDSYLYAPDICIIEPRMVPGQAVAQGQIIGLQHRFDRIDDVPCPITAPHDGLIVALNGQGRVAPGDCIAVLGEVQAAP